MEGHAVSTVDLMQPSQHSPHSCLCFSLAVAAWWCHTQAGGTDPWWTVDLGAEYSVERVRIWRNYDVTSAATLAGFEIRLGRWMPMARQRWGVWQGVAQTADQFDAQAWPKPGLVHAVWAWCMPSPEAHRNSWPASFPRC
jgi:hypothetical protein